jgi:hypothetical protein
MNYQINRAGQTVGTYDFEALKAAVQAGQVLPTDFVWAPGMPEWKSVSIFLAEASAPPSQSSAISAERIRAVASNHRAMNLCLLVSILAMVLLVAMGGVLAASTDDQAGRAIGGFLLMSAFYVLALVLFVFWCVKVYKLADALQAGPAFLWVIGMLVPCFSYVIVLVLSQKAGNFLKANGVKVGFLGADTSTLP